MGAEQEHFFSFLELKNDRRYHVNVSSKPPHRWAVFSNVLQNLSTITLALFETQPTPQPPFFFVLSPQAKPHVYIKQCNVQLTPSQLCTTCACVQFSFWQSAMLLICSCCQEQALHQAIVQLCVWISSCHGDSETQTLCLLSMETKLILFVTNLYYARGTVQHVCRLNNKAA